ncbi:MAG: Ig-like domain-containing protein [Gemmatimonadales bacterium]
MPAVRLAATPAVLVALALHLSTAAAQQPAVAKVVISPAHPEVVAGDSLRLTAEALDAAGQAVPGAQIRFSPAGNVPLAQVEPDGLVRSGAVGTMPVVAAAIVPGGKPVIARTDVRIVPGPAARIAIADMPERLVPGQSVRLSAQVFSAAGDSRGDTVVWSTSAANVVRVSRAGLAEARKPGKAVLTAIAGRATASVPITVLAAAPASLVIEPAAVTVRQGDVVRFKAVARDAAGRAIAGVSPAWALTPGEGVIGPDGAFVAYGVGAYTVTATLGARSATAAVAATSRRVRRQATVVGRSVRRAFPTSEVWVHPNGRVAYLGTHLGGDRFYTLDVSDPANPVIVDSVVANTRLINDIMTDAEGRVLVFTRENAADRMNGIVICSLADPLRPKVIAEFTEDVTGGVHSAFVYSQPSHGTHIYLTNDATGAMHVVDINDPARPKEVGRWQPPRANVGRYLHDVDVQDGLLYGSWWHDGLIILDVGNGVKGGSPSNPQVVAQYKYDLDSLYRQVAEASGPGFIRGTHTAWRHRNYVFIADEVFGQDAVQALLEGRPSRAYGRLQVLDVSQLERPKLVAWYEPEYGGVHNVWVAGDTLYLGAYNAGFRAFDITGELRGDLRAQGREMVHVAPSDSAGFIPNMPMTWGVVVRNGLAYVNDFNTGLFVVRMEPRREEPAPLVP